MVIFLCNAGRGGLQPKILNMNCFAQQNFVCSFYYISLYVLLKITEIVETKKLSYKTIQLQNDSFKPLNHIFNTWFVARLKDIIKIVVRFSFFCIQHVISNLQAET